MSRSVPQSLALQASSIVMQEIVKLHGHELFDLEPGSDRANVIYSQILRHGQAAYEAGAKILGVAKINSIADD